MSDNQEPKGTEENGDSGGHKASLEQIEEYLDTIPEDAKASIEEKAAIMGMTKEQLLRLAQRLNDQLVDEEKSKKEP